MAYINDRETTTKTGVQHGNVREYLYPMKQIPNNNKKNNFLPFVS